MINKYKFIIIYSLFASFLISISVYINMSNSSVDASTRIVSGINEIPSEIITEDKPVLNVNIPTTIVKAIISDITSSLPGRSVNTRKTIIVIGNFKLILKTNLGTFLLNNNNTPVTLTYDTTIGSWIDQTYSVRAYPLTEKFPGVDINPLDATSDSLQGVSSAISGDGNTLAMGGIYDTRIGAVWIFVKNSSGIWLQQGNKLVPSDVSGGPLDTVEFGISVALSYDGNTLVAGGQFDSINTGAVWIFNRNDNIWTKTIKLVGIDVNPFTFQGTSVAINEAGNIIVSGGWADNGLIGAVWIFKKDSNDLWKQYGSKLTSNVALSRFGTDVALNSVGDILAVGAPTDGPGKIYTYIDNNMGNWTLIREFSDPAAFELGYRVDISAVGTTIVGYASSNGTIGIFSTLNTNVVTFTLNDFSLPLITQYGFIIGDVTINRQGNLICASSAVKNNAELFALDSTTNIWSRTGQTIHINELPIDLNTSLQGASLSLKSNILLIGAPRRNEDIGAVHILNIVNNIANYDRTIYGSDYTRASRFGNSVSMSADMKYAVIGGVFDGTGKRGSAWMYKRDGSFWRRIGNKLTPPGKPSIGYAGISVDINANGSVVVVGSLNNRMYIYNKNINSELWELTGTLIGTDEGASSSEWFGEMVRINDDGTKIAIGSSLHSFGSNNQGAIWYFTYNGTSWSSPGPVEGPGTLLDSFMAMSAESVPYPAVDLFYYGPNTLAISGDGTTIVAGAPLHNSFEGGVWVFLNGVYQDGPLQGTGTVGDTTEQGQSVALSYDGNTLAVGAPSYNILSAKGAIIVYTRSGATWSEQQIITISTSERLGFAVDLSADGNILIASETISAVGPGQYKGKMWVFERVSGVWIERTDTPITPTEADDFVNEFQHFGYSLSISGDGSISIAGVPGRILTPLLTSTGGIYAIS